MGQDKDGVGGVADVAKEARALAEELRIIWEGDAWHGPALRELLVGLTAEQAARRVVPEGHTLWELVLHVAGWTDVFRRRLEGERIDEPDDGDFPGTGEPTPDAWAAALARLARAQEWIVQRVSRLSDAELDAPVPGRDYSRRFLVQGAVRHVVYHSGQVALLRRALS